MLKRIAEYWCQTTHRRTTWPIHGKYICQECGREYPVCWYLSDPVAVTDTPRRMVEPRELSMNASLSVVREA